VASIPAFFDACSVASSTPLRSWLLMKLYAVLLLVKIACSASRWIEKCDDLERNSKVSLNIINIFISNRHRDVNKTFLQDQDQDLLQDQDQDFRNFPRPRPSLFGQDQDQDLHAVSDTGNLAKDSYEQCT